VKGDSTLHALIDCDLLVGCEGGLKHWTEAVKQGLDLALGGAIIDIRGIGNALVPPAFRPLTLNYPDVRQITLLTPYIDISTNGNVQREKGGVRGY
jgi:hypothetical protein